MSRSFLRRIATIALAAVATIASTRSHSNAQDRPATTDKTPGLQEAREGRSPRQIRVEDVATPPGYKVEAWARDLSYPVDITFDDQGNAYVAEAGGHTYGTKPEKAPPAQIIKFSPEGTKRQVIVGKDSVLPLAVIKKHETSAEMPEGIIMPLTGCTWHDGTLYVSHRSRYSRVDPNTGDVKTIVNGLMSWGEFLNAKPVFDREGRMVWFLSTQGNSGVVEDHWIKVIRTFSKPKAHEIPGEDVTLTGINYPAPTEPKGKPGLQPTVPTGVYVPLGVKTENGQVIPGQKFCNGAFFRTDLKTGETERIAWGFRSSFGYRFSPDGRLFTTQNSANPMKPRGIRYDFEPIYEVKEGLWYGWPDFYSGIPITDKRFKVREGPQEFVLTKDTHSRLLKGEPLPPQPVAKLPVHSAAEGMVFARKEFGLNPDNILVASMGSIVPLYKTEYGDWPEGEGTPGDYPPAAELAAAKVPPEKPGIEPWPGFMVSLVDLESGKHQPFLVNKSGKPASASKGGGLERPVQLEWGPDGALYVVDFGVIEFHKGGMTAHPNTGVIWKVTKVQR